MEKKPQKIQQTLLSFPSCISGFERCHFNFNYELSNVIFATNETGIEEQTLLAQAPADLCINPVLGQQTIFPVLNYFGCLVVFSFP